jgi:hypothetical protein
LDPSEDIEENRRNLIALTQKVFDAIVSSADKYDIFFFYLIFWSLMQVDYFNLSLAVEETLVTNEIFL